MDRDIELHQALHGYADGHQLLASSLELTREQQWQMLVMSDLSGPSFRAGFDGYLTGYPLETGGFYCIAKTWFAMEMPRPGCVWTHSLLISDTDLARVDEIWGLASVFRRPEAGTLDLESYSRPLHADTERSKPAPIDSAIGNTLVHLLYDTPSQRVVITSESALGYEEALIATFSQQWPRLRRSFRFCTGALAIRDVPFDVAIAPPNVMRAETEKLVTVRAGDATPVNEGWVLAAANDLVQSDSHSSLRRFLWTFGPDYPQGRMVFRALCEIQIVSSRSPDGLEEVLSALAHFFPEPESSRRLKAAFVGVSGTFTKGPHGEASVLEALIAHPAARCIASDVASIQERAGALINSNHGDAIRIGAIAATVAGPRAEQYLDGLVAGLHSQPRYLRSVPPSLMLAMLRRDPGLLAEPELWKTSTEEQLILAAQLGSLRDVEKYARQITKAIVAVNAWPILATVLGSFGVDAVSAVLEWIDATPDSVITIPDALLAALRDQRHLFVSALAQGHPGPGSLRVATALLDPRSNDVRELGASIWAKVSDRDLSFADANIELRSRAFLLSLGLSLSGETAVRLVREGFSAVYESAKYSRLNESLWGFVEPYLPWYFLTWDRCARLTRGVVQQFLDRHWSPADFVATFRTHEQFGSALAEAEDAHRGHRYVREVCQQVKSGTLVVDDLYAAELARYCDLTP